MACDLCGKEGQLYQAKVEGSVMTICDSCKSYASDVIRRVPSAKEKEVASKLKAKQQEEYSSSPSLAPKGEILLLVRPDYAKVIKAAREKSGLKQEDMAKKLKVKESQLHKYESGSHMPDLETARLLEKELKIKLVQEHKDEAGPAARHGGAASFTLGDFVKRRK